MLMHERIVVGVLRVVAKRESSFVDFRLRESGMRVTRLGLERRAAVQGIRKKGAVVSEGAMVDVFVCVLFVPRGWKMLFLDLPVCSDVLQQTRYDVNIFSKEYELLRTVVMDKLSSFPSPDGDGDGDEVGWNNGESSECFTSSKRTVVNGNAPSRASIQDGGEDQTPVIFS